MKRLFGLVFAGLLFLSLFSAPALAGRDNIKVMTRNQYLGADLTPFTMALTPEDIAEAASDILEQIAHNFFPLRARRFATEIALTKPDLIGLQEVLDLKLNGLNVGPPFVDHLAETLDALAARGQSYVKAAEVVNLEFELFFDVDGDGIMDFISAVDRDVILARQGVFYEKLVGDSDDGGLCGVDIPNPLPASPFPAMLHSMPSEDGCTYTVLVPVSSPDVPILAIKRGFVGVDATVRGKDYRIVNTHLEVEQPYPGIPDSAAIQSLQAAELVGTLQFLTSRLPPNWASDHGGVFGKLIFR